MKINAPVFGFAAAATCCIMYSAFALILKYWPAQTLKFIGTIHMLPKLDYIKSFIKVTPQAIILGIITHTAIAFIIFCFIAIIYNRIEGILKK